MKVLRMFLGLVLVIVGVFAVVSIYLYFNQKNMMFYPTKDLAVTPGDINIAFEDVFIDTSDRARLHAWYVQPQTESKKVVLFCHGNAGNISHRLETVEFLYNRGVNVLIFDYRGYGRSTGEPDEDGLYADATACYEWLKQGRGFSPDSIYIFGRSLGGAVAIELATKVPCAALIVESSFTTAAEMADKIFPILPTRLLLKYEFRSIDKIDRVNCPLLVTHSPDDDLVPFEMGRALFERANEPKEFVELFGGHNDRGYINSPPYVEAFKRLFATTQ
ncbi:MAG: alpha/beta hydrolase [Candidatus Zixiibacteriota bacterium]